MQRDQGEKENEKQEQPLVFHKKMEIPQRAAMEQRWKDFKKFFEKDSKALTESFDLAQNTAFHVATRSDNPRLFRELMELLPVEERWHALRKSNSHKNTILHQAIYCKNLEVVDVILDFEKNVPPPPRDEEGGRGETEKHLLELTNELGETPVYRAAKIGKLKMLIHLAKSVGDLTEHYHRKSKIKSSILHAAVLGQYFDVAIWLLRKDEKLAKEQDKDGYTCLQLLSNMPSVFHSHCCMGTIKKLIYSLLPEKGYDYQDGEDDNNNILRKKKDLERGEEDQVQQNSVTVLSRINQAIWKFLAEEWEAIEHLWQKKKEHMLAEELAKILVKNDNSWQNTYNTKQRSVVILQCNERKKQSEPKNKENQGSAGQARNYSAYAPLLLAASNGIMEIVEKIIYMYPDAINHVSEDEQNILHVAVKHRQRWKFIKL